MKIITKEQDEMLKKFCMIIASNNPDQAIAKLDASNVKLRRDNGEFKTMCEVLSEMSKKSDKV